MLTSASISNDQVERGAQELLYEFMRGYFTGAPVTIGGQPRTLPLLPQNTALLSPWLFNQQSLLGSPDAIVHTIFNDLKPRENPQTDDQKLVRVDLTASLYVRVQNPVAGFQTADNTCRVIADGLRQIFESEHYNIAQKQIHHAKVRRGPKPLSTNAMQTRLLIVTMQLQYLTAY